MILSKWTKTDNHPNAGTVLVIHITERYVALEDEILISGKLENRHFLVDVEILVIGGEFRVVGRLEEVFVYLTAVGVENQRSGSLCFHMAVVDQIMILSSC